MFFFRIPIKQILIEQDKMSRRARISNDISLELPPAPAGQRSSNSMIAVLDAAVHTKVITDQTNLSMWKVQILQLDNSNPAKATLFAKYTERLAQFLKRRASYKTTARFLTR